ncbi:MAG: phosphoadenosine phosphosulfate reductase family protein [Atribacterota bacterium]|nr:phosphoadenosine phosphosulfate reductase family protein [Atribacterota bacterium]
MSLIEYTLEGKVDRVQVAIERLKSFEPPEGYYLAFSGGKDSIVCYELCKMSKVKFDTHFNFTTVDPPELVKFIKDNYPDVEIHKPGISMFKLISKKLMPPTRRVRYCCEFLKERGGSGRLVVTGIRSQESYKRTKRRMVESCYKDITKRYINPIIDWTEYDVWEFIKQKELKYCSLYNEGYKRIGCVLCPMQTKRMKLVDIKRYPKFYRAYLLAFKNMLDQRKLKNKKTEWKTPEEVMDWWINEPSKQKQDTLFN